MTHEKNIIKLAKKIDILISFEQAEKFISYMNLILEFNKKINLTSIKEPEKIITKHFLDSISILSCKHDLNLNKNNLRVIDIGSGAGLPGVPIKIMRDKINMNLLDSLTKRVNFLEIICEKLNLTHTHCINSRAEEFVRLDNNRESYDLCVTRAVFKLNILLEICMPFVKLNGFLVMYKSKNILCELSRDIIKIFGGEVCEIKKINLQDLEDHVLIIIKKNFLTPSKFPRAYKKIIAQNKL